MAERGADLNANTAALAELFGCVVKLMDGKGCRGGTAAFRCANKSSAQATLTFHSGNQFRSLSSPSSM